MNLKQLLVGVALTVTSGLALATTPAVVHAAAIPDISEWQGELTAAKVKKLKNQVNFVINRRQYGSGYVDKYAANNTALYVKYGVKFGEYDFATFKTVAEAQNEAKLFYQRSNKNALFYVLDYEENNSGSSNATTTNKLVNAWYTQMRKLTKKKLIFYSYASFATTYANVARKKFDAQWIASYGSTPTIPYALWQYTNSYYLSSLGLKLDNSKVNTTVHSLNWWLSSSNNSATATSNTANKTTTSSSSAAKATKTASSSAANAKTSSSIASNAIKVSSSSTTAKTSSSSSRAKVINQATKSSSSSAASAANKTSSTNSAFSNYQMGQTVTLKTTAARYYDNSKIARSVKNKKYVILSTKPIAKSRSKQAVFVAGLNKWILSQDVAKANVAEYSRYENGQMGYIRATAAYYYPNSKVAASVKKKGYKITKVKSVSKSRSKQAVYLSGVNKWVLSQDITGMINQNYKYYIVKSKQFTFADKYMKTTNGKSINTNTAFSASLVKLTRNIMRLKTSKGYITSDVRYVEPQYYTTTGTRHYVTVKAGKLVYLYNRNSFKATARAKQLTKNTKYQIKSVVKQANGRYYFKTTNGYYVTADKLQVVLH